MSQSPVPEDYRHAENVLEWVMRLSPDAGLALRLAAVGHDIERALPEEKVVRSAYPSYDAFKKAHAENSARILRRLLRKYPFDDEIIERVCFLVRHHEFGVEGDREVEVLKDADSLSFFECNLPYYLEREGEEKALERMRWGYRRLSEKGKLLLSQLPLNEELVRKMNAA